MTVSSTGTTTTTTSYGGTPVIQFSGLASGLDTSSIISELMQVEAVPQTLLKNRMAAEQTQVTALQSVNSAFAALSTAAQSFATGSTWTQLAATSSSSSISVTASSSAVPANVTVVVNNTAQGAQANVTTPPAAATTYTVLGADGTPLKDSSGNAIAFTPKDTSLSSIADAINATTSTSNLKAVLINPTGANGTAPMLEILSTQTGAASNFKITGADGSVLADTTVAPDPASDPPVVMQGKDASISVDGQTITSSSNTFKSVMPGVDLTVTAGTAAATKSTISVTDDGTSRASGIKLFVQQINTLLQTVASQTAYGSISTSSGTASSGAGALAGNPDLRDLATQLVNTIFPSDGTSMADYGLDVDKDGNLTFDQDAFTAAYQADPDKVQAAFIGKATTNVDDTTTGMDGFVTRVQKLADLASDPYAGTLTASIKSMNAEINDYSDQISDWDDRLAAKQASLQTIYTNLETKLSTLQSQSEWLSSQLDSLDSGWTQNQS